MAKTKNTQTYTAALRTLVLEKADQVKDLTGLADSGVGRAAVKDANFVRQLRNGANVTTAKLEQLETWLDRQLAEEAERAAKPEDESREGVG